MAMVAKDEIYDQESPQYDQTGAENEPEVHGVENIGDEDVISSDPEVEIVFGLMDVTARNVLHSTQPSQVAKLAVSVLRIILKDARWRSIASV